MNHENTHTYTHTSLRWFLLIHLGRKSKFNGLCCLRAAATVRPISLNMLSIAFTKQPMHRCIQTPGAVKRRQTWNLDEMIFYYCFRVVFVFLYSTRVSFRRNFRFTSLFVDSLCVSIYVHVFQAKTFKNYFGAVWTNETKHTYEICFLFFFCFWLCLSQTFRSLDQFFCCEFQI